MAGDSRPALVATLRTNSEEAARWGSPMYSRLCERMVQDVEAGGPTWRLLERYATEPADEYYPFRALAGVHHMVLRGELPELAKHYPSEGGDGDADAAWPIVRDAFGRMPHEVVASLGHPLQTNETARCGALIGGFLTVAAETGLPLRAREVGASAGLNLHFDRYRYEQDGKGFGPEGSPVRFVDHWRSAVPPFDAPLRVSSRRGCDIDPIDPTTDEGRLSLLAFMFPDQLRRYELLSEAIEVARGFPNEVDRESVETWLARELRELPEGEATVVFHSLFWIYLPERIREETSAVIREAASRASSGHPLAWLRYELGADLVQCELRLTAWPGGEESLLATGDVHIAPVTWLG
ncbi:MAG: DUF2332 domain-containing protein [Solirubrobacterales bacterium]